MMFEEKIAKLNSQQDRKKAIPSQKSKRYWRSKGILFIS